MKSVRTFALVVLILFTASMLYAQVIVTNDPPLYGPYNANILRDGSGLSKPLKPSDTLQRADLPWSLYAWVNAEEVPQALTLIAGMGDPAETTPRYLAVENNRLELWMGNDNAVAAPAVLSAGEWHLIAATFDGSEFQLYEDGTVVGRGTLLLGSTSPVLEIAPTKMPRPVRSEQEPLPKERPRPSWQHFGGKIAGLTLVRRALSADEIKQLHSQRPDFSLVIFEEGSKPWPQQTRQQVGYRAPQDPSTMPKSKAPFSQPVARPVPKISPSLQPSGTNEWTLAGGWMLTPAPRTTADAAALSQANFQDKDWWPATVPGTVLTTMIDRGVYPDPDYGLNNLAIPEGLNKQNYWYRNEFKAPKIASAHHLTLTFQGINYKADVWLNSQSLGTIKGAFIRGTFDVTNILKPGQTNVLVVRVSPPPHPGIPHEQSIKAGPGENGGMMCIDGPTFVATEGWDWVPAVRDRDTGIWQPVTLTATGDVRIGDAQVVTSLPLPDTSRADIEITVPLENVSSTPAQGTLTASFDNITVTKQVSVAPGKSSVKLTPAEFSQLTVQHPRLWWPNGYGKPELYNLRLTFAEGNQQSDVKQLRFGIREITYELSLLDSTGHLRRVEYSPTVAHGSSEPVVNVTHAGMREIPATDPPPSDWPPEWRAGWTSWAASLTPQGSSSPAIRTVQDTNAAPFLVIKVNGVRIATRGGNWGMDDSRKRVSRERLEPYFRLHRNANLNIIRNWVGQNTEEVFYDLADEYGMLVWNDFWDSTQNYNAEIEDPALFLANARDTILRFRNHPSIVLWCGRNEGVPQPILNEGLDELARSLDGTRYYSPSSNQINLQNSGPYKYQDPSLYYTTLNHGFSVETGTPSFSTLESFRAWIPSQDQWPISDDWAYHDWHQGGNGDMAPFAREMETEFGAPTNLEDFERKAQMLDYVSHRAIFEGMNAHLWAPNSGRLLWMTQPAWPSNTWQILSSDYDTQSSFYAVKKACEPVHVQLDLSNYNVDVVNTTNGTLTGLIVTAKVFSLDGKLLLTHEQRLDCAADSVFTGLKLEVEPLIANAMAIVKLELRNSAGQLLSDNFYWLGDNSLSYRQLTRLPMATLTTKAVSTRTGDTSHVHVELKNAGNAVALMSKLTLTNADDGTRILPAYLSDNYVSLLPGETRAIDIEYPTSAARSTPQLTLRGWNVTPATIAVEQQK
jgi:beta-galactosidase/beta-glucuronidase